MDFKFRSIDNRPSNCFPSPPKFPASNNNLSYFTHEAIRAGFTGAESSRRAFFRNSNPNAIPESIQRELEKERIRAEIMAEEVFRRRILEEEVRREMMFEREMALRRGEREIGFGSSSSSMHYKTRVPMLTNFDHRTGVSSYRKAGSETLPFQRDPVVAENGDGYGNAFSPGLKLKEIKEIKGFDPDVNKDKAIILGKPDASDLKRKATKPPIGATDYPSTVSKKPKIQEGWSCALCRVTATSERALNDHLLGKKHKARESGLNSQRTGFGTVPLPKMGSTCTTKPIKVPGATNKQSSRKKDDKAGGETSLVKVDNEPTQELPKTKTDKKITLMKGKETSKKKNEKAAVPKKASTSAKSKNTYKFVCEICQVGTYSLKVMNAHKKGKPHLEEVKKLNESDEAASCETPALKVIVENKEPNMAASVEKGVVEENKNHYIVTAKETNNGTPAQRGVVKVKKGNKESDMAASVDKSLVVEKKELCIGAAN